ncbi:VOC family protein [Nakamurella lactea]|uniref:VOC family protein n=1 Tax=Nakamurella lactea TaxID=459515 RepID=UPI0003F95CBA|nr:VOC family protein [Nakamurella lactea]
MSAPAILTTVILDCADPTALAEFYRKALGWNVIHADEDGAQLDNGGPIRLGLQRVAGYRGPTWPDPAKHAHFDLEVADPATAADELIALGASRPDFQPGNGDWLVLADPEGHLFCIAAAG